MTNVGVVGCGYWGPNLIRNLLVSKLSGRIVCCDTDPVKLERVSLRYPTVGLVQTMDELLKDSGLDAVVIATPVSTHFSLARKALRADRHVFIEKPFTATVEEGEELVELAAKKNKVLMVGHTFEFSPPVMRIGELISSGELGKVFFISMARVNLGLHQKDVSVVWDLAPHDLSMLFYWLRETPLRVSALGKDFVQKGIPDVAFVSLEFGSGVIAHIQVSWLSPSKLRRTTIVGSGKMLVYDDTDHLEKVKIFDKGVDYRDPVTFGEYQLSYRTGDIVSPHLESYEPLQAEMDHFLECVQTGQRPRTDGHSGLRVVRVLEAIERSISNNSHVEVMQPEYPHAKVSASTG